MKQRGSALMTVVIAILILLSVSGIFFYLVNHQARIISSEEKALKAYYMAEAGINYGVAYLLTRIENGSDILNFTSNTIEVDNYEGGFVVSVTKEGNDLTISSKGFYPASHQYPVTRSLSATIPNISVLEDSDNLKIIYNYEMPQQGQRHLSLYEDTSGGSGYDQGKFKNPPPIGNKDSEDVIYLKHALTNNGGKPLNNEEARDVYFSFIDASNDQIIHGDGQVVIIRNGIETVLPQNADGRFGPYILDPEEVVLLRVTLPKHAMLRIKIEGDVFKNNGQRDGTYVTITNVFFVGNPAQWQQEQP